MSTMKAELIVLDTATVEAEWLHELLMDLPVVDVTPRYLPYQGSIPRPTSDVKLTTSRPLGVH
jgi:hypothetical protein